MADQEYFIWKAKHQRGLSDEEIQYFLDNHSQWEHLPLYAKLCKKIGCSAALKAVEEAYGEE